MPDVDKNYGVSLVLDFGTWWRHVKTIYSVYKKGVLHLRCERNQIVQLCDLEEGVITFLSAQLDTLSIN